MPRSGLLIFVVGVVVSSWYAARFVPEADIRASMHQQGEISATDRLLAWGKVAGAPFSVGALLMIAGAVLERRSMRQSGADFAVTGTIANTLDSLRQIDAAIKALPEPENKEISARLHTQLDELLEETIPAFLAHRDHHIRQLGALTFAEMSSAFASSERALARAWSALTDESTGEVPGCLEIARQSISHAVEISQGESRGDGSPPRPQH